MGSVRVCGGERGDYQNFWTFPLPQIEVEPSAPKLGVPHAAWAAKVFVSSRYSGNLCSALRCFINIINPSYL